MTYYSKLSKALSRARREIAKDEQRSRGRMNEKETLHHLIEPVLGAVGWAMDDSDQVRREYPTTLGHVDLALLIDDEPVLFVEAKALKHSVNEEKWIKQTVDYANGEGVDWCILTNGAEYRIYQTRAPGAFNAKLFNDVNIDISSEDKAEQSVETLLSLLSPQSMKLNSLKKLWDMRDVDRRVQFAIGNIVNKPEFREFVSQQIGTNSIAAATISESLKRATFSVDYPSISECVEMVTEIRPENDTSNIHSPATDNTQSFSQKIKNTKKMRTPDMVEAGLLPVGTVLTIKNYPGSEAQVVDGRHVNHRGKVMTFSKWGTQITGWPSINIYAYALLPNGKSLGDLRNADGSTRKRGNSTVSHDASIAQHNKSKRQTKTSTSSRSSRKSKMKIPAMVDKGLLKVGTTLKIKNRPGSDAKVVDGRHVIYRGEIITFMDWGRRVTGWSTLQIYVHAVLPDGSLLDDLRK